ncbi:hypothetical protein B0H13DRAFT_1858501 [Mycena leptocephala]|nr:hypothetical protein B0H13DRAFT_1858501 [Mycena leptocephala]
MSVRTGIRRFVDGDASRRTQVLVKALLGCGRCTRACVTRRLWGGLGCPRAVLASVCNVGDLTSTIPILEAKNASTHSPSMVCRPFGLYVVNICHVVPRSRSLPPLAPSVSCCYRNGSLEGLEELLGRLDAWFYRWSHLSRVRDSRHGACGYGRAGMHALVRRGWRARAALGLAPAMYSCRVYAQCISLSHSAAYAGPSIVGMGSGMGPMLLSCSTSAVGTGRGGVRGVRAGRECASGWNAGVCCLRSVNLGVHGAPVYDGSAWGTPQGTGQAAGDMPMLWDRMARGMRRMPKKGNTWHRLYLAACLDVLDTTFTLKFGRAYFFLNVNERENYQVVFSSASISTELQKRYSWCEAPLLCGV